MVSDVAGRGNIVTAKQ